MTTAANREHLHELMGLMVQHRAQLDYPSGDVRGPKDAATFKLTELQMRSALAEGGRLMFDCSQFVTQLCHWAGLHDPNGLAYSHAGYTGTMLQTLRHYSDPLAAHVGALVVFGPGTGEHVSMVYQRGPDPLLCSHGHAGLDLVRLSRQRTWHRPPVTLLSISPL